MEEVKLTSLVRSSGCNAKLPPGDLHKALDGLEQQTPEALIEGFESSDDALVYDLGDGRVLIETVDFLPPMVDDPGIFGEIAAANAISDIYAMGGDPKLAMSLMCFPSCLDISVMRRIMTGAVAKAEEAGVVIAGGHTLSDREPKFGLAVTGFADKDKVWSNKGAEPGDSVILTKKLGVGLLMTAHKAGETDASEAISQMRKLNKYAREAAEGLTVHAATDVTGFSLMGHSYEAASASGVSIIIDSKFLRFLPGAEEAARFGFVPEGRYTNEDYLEDKVQLPDGIPLHLRDMLFSPETSGGLLLFMPPEDADEYLKRYPEAFLIGSATEQKGKPVIVI